MTQEFLEILSIEASDMGNDQQEIADYVEGIIDRENRQYKTKEGFYKDEFELIGQACKEMGWHSVPQTGGLIVNWR